MQVEIGKWVARQAGPDAVIATNDIGAIAFFGQRRIIDTVGLATPEIIPVIHRPPADPSAWLGTNQRALLGFLRERRPEYLIIFPRWYPWLATQTKVLHEVKRVYLADNTTCGGPLMVVYRCDWGTSSPRGSGFSRDPQLTRSRRNSLPGRGSRRAAGQTSS
jgi:hypothetical protein